jgi:4-hydroxy-4-methyl-2-oxoglutarate aldolase
MTVKQPLLDDTLIARARHRSASTLHEAGGKVGALPAVIKPFAAEVTVCGRAFPVKSPSGDNLWLHHAIYAAAAGDVLVVDVGADTEFGYWGEVMAVAAQARAIAGLVINGGVRDAQRLLAMRFPVFCSGACIRGTGKNIHGQGSLGQDINIGNVTVRRGDLVLGDRDGVVVLPAATAAQIVDVGERRDAEEDEIFRRLRHGGTTLEIYHLPTPDGLKSKP